jgi:endonuclease/exonuclease/phosphatase family metal-dependent hydrolase
MFCSVFSISPDSWRGLLLRNPLNRQANTDHFILSTKKKFLKFIGKNVSFSCLTVIIVLGLGIYQEKRKKIPALKTLFRYIMIMLNLGTVLALLITYMSVYISPAKIWVLAFFGLAYPYILLLNFLFILYWLFNRWKLSLLSLLTILIGYNHLQNYFQIGKKITSEKGIVICSYNVKHFNGLTGTVDWEENATRIQNYLRSKNADIVCLQEVSSSSMKKFNPFITASASPDPHMNSTNLDNNTGPAIFSRHPIINMDEIRFDNSVNMIVFADIKMPEDTIRVYSCHLQSYQFSDDDMHSLESLSIENQKLNIMSVRIVGSKLKHAFIKRTAHTDHLSESIRQSPYPVIVCGDFNDSPVSYTYRTVRGGLKDAFVESGAGTANTYRGSLPSFRIDYILHSAYFTGYNFMVDKVDYSDHYPVSCKLVKTSK